MRRKVLPIRACAASRPASLLTLTLGFCGLSILGLVAPQICQAAEETNRPNIVVMLADDMGFGELQCLNPTHGKIKTPQLDAIAASGMIFTDAHSGSSVCTPTRYGMLTGRYAWRTRLQSGVLTGGESLIAPGRMTLASMLKAEGYHTAIVGKWHLGMLFDGKHVAGDVPIGTQVTDGPLDRGGFDEFHGFHHARQIKLWIDNDEVTEHLEPVEMLPKLTETAVQYIRGRKSEEAPFFLYVPWSSPHSPVAPSEAWQGKSGLNPHADFVMQTDDSFGQVVNALRETGALENTLIICSSDNGTSAPTSKMADLLAMGHHPSGELRGSKADIWDGGHRVPFLVSWPGNIEPGSRSSNLVCLTDLAATLADVVGIELPANCAEDSLSFLPSLTGDGKPVRTSVIHHSISGYFALRDQQWKLCTCPGSGGWTKPTPSAAAWKRAAEAGNPLVQLYDMSADLSEQTNLASQMPDRVEALSEQLQAAIEQGWTAPGKSGSNDAAIVVMKQPKGLKKSKAE